MFKQQCLIRKITPKLIEELKGFGYECFKSSENGNRKNGILCNGKIAVALPDNCDGFDIDTYLSENPKIVDCGWNDEMFLALAALRNDTDKHQWFICKEEFLNYSLETVKVGTWQKCIFDKLSYSQTLRFRKAKKDEIITHFKTEFD